MAKATVPMPKFREKFGDIPADRISDWLHDIAAQFLHDGPPIEKKREAVSKA